MGSFAPPGEDSRETPRATCSREVYVEVLGGETYPAALMDVSASGFRVMVDGQIEAGTVVRLQLSRDRAESAVVIWQRGTVIGCQLAEPLSRIALKAMIAGLGLERHPSGRFGYGDTSAPCL
jgi:hypothetical protein